MRSARRELRRHAPLTVYNITLQHTGVTKLFRTGTQRRLPRWHRSSTELHSDVTSLQQASDSPGAGYRLRLRNWCVEGWWLGPEGVLLVSHGPIFHHFARLHYRHGNSLTGAPFMSTAPVEPEGVLVIELRRQFWETLSLATLSPRSQHGARQATRLYRRYGQTFVGTTGAAHWWRRACGTGKIVAAGLKCSGVPQVT